MVSEEKFDNIKNRQDSNFKMANWGLGLFVFHLSYSCWNGLNGQTILWFWSNIKPFQLLRTRVTLSDLGAQFSCTLVVACW